MEEKTLDVTSSKDFTDDIQVHGDPDLWCLICKAWNKKEGWMKSTKAMNAGNGVLIQVSTETLTGVAEAITYVEGLEVKKAEGSSLHFFAQREFINGVRV